MNVLVLNEVKKYYGQDQTLVKAVDGISLTVKAGEIILIMGPSGSGKTTLLTLIGCLLTPTSGSIQLNGKDITATPQTKLPDIRLLEIGFVFQSFNLLQNLTARENVQLVGELAHLSPRQARNRAEALLTKLHLDDRLDYIPAKLSGGQQQRVAIARALINNPKLILADEPTGDIDSKTGYEVMMLFHNIAKEEGKSVVIVSHDERIRDIADRTLWIEDGKISPEPPRSETMIKDPVCGMRVDEKYAVFTTTHAGQDYKFCSADCLKKFSQQPAQYIRPGH